MEGPAWAMLTIKPMDFWKNARKGLTDPDKPITAKTRKSTFDGPTSNLVFSDEFTEENRTFYPGDDPF